MRWTREQWLDRCRPDQSVFAVPGIAREGEDAPEVLVSGMSGATRIKFLTECANTDAETAGIEVLRLFPGLIQECLHDTETRERIFAEGDDVSSMPIGAQVACVNEIIRLSHLGDIGVEALAGNSFGIPSEQPSSPSPIAGDAPPPSS